MTKYKKLHFNGNFGDFFLYNFLLLLLDMITMGIASIYHVWWNIKYVIDNLSIEE